MISCVPAEPIHYEKIVLGERHKHEIIGMPKVGAALAFLNGEDVVAILGGHLIFNGVLQVWAFISDAVRKCPVSFHKSVVGILGFYFKEFKLRRMQFSVRSDFDMGIKWAESLGFRAEGLMKNYAQDGMSCWLYAKVSE